VFKFKQEFLDTYKDKRVPFGPIGSVTYKRTYSRDILNELQDTIGKESFQDTIARVIEGNVNLGMMVGDPTANEKWAKEAYEYMFHMAVLPPGRGLWMMGTEYATKRGGDALVNCWYTGIRPQSYEDFEMLRDRPYIYSDRNEPMPSFPFVFMFDRAMLGGGVGVGVSQKNLDLMPKVSTQTILQIFLHKNHPDWERIRESEEWERIKDFITDDPFGFDKHDPAFLFTEDDREGWDMSVREVIDAHFQDTMMNYLKIDLSRIRGYGTKIVGFGGTASGPLPLIAALVDINNILNSRANKNMSSVDALDIINLLGRCVVAGNVRRTALIALGDADDQEYMDAKNYKLAEVIKEKDENGYTIWEKNAWGRKVERLRPREEVIEEFHEQLTSNLCEGMSRVEVDDPSVQGTIDGELWEKAEEQYSELLNLYWKQDNHRWASNNSVYTNEMFKDFHFIAAGIMVNGEPGIANEFLMKNYGRLVDGFQQAIDGDAEGLNPCFRGDMKLLTTDGYKTFEELEGTTPTIINKDGEVSLSKVWCSGHKDIVEVKFNNRPNIYVTPDHVFLTTDNKEVKAKDLKGRRIMPGFNRTPEHINMFVRMGFIQGDGSLQKAKDDDGLDVHVGKKDNDIYELFGKPSLQKSGRVFYWTSDVRNMKDLGFNMVKTDQRTLPETYKEWTYLSKVSFLRGLYSANGSVLKNGRVTFKSVSAQLIEQLQEALNELGIESYITTNKESDVEWYNGGTYTSKQSYDLNVQQYLSRVNFYNKIGFVQEYKENKLRDTLIKTSPYVVSINNAGKAKVYDFTEPLTHWGIVEGVVAHNCGEIPLAPEEPCNLVEFVPVNARKFNLDPTRALEIATQYAYRITFAKYMWTSTQRVISKHHRIGVSITGAQDYFLDAYGHYAVKEFKDGDITKPVYYSDIVAELNEWYDIVKKTNIVHAELMDSPPSNKLTTNKPSGTVAKMPGVSAGIHFHYSPYMIQRMRFHETDPIIPVLIKCGYPVEKAVKEPNTMVASFPIKNPNADNPLFKSAGNVSLAEQLANQALFATYWADNAVSATNTFQPHEVDDIEPLLKAYSNKLKSTSLLPYTGHGYVQAPWEPISKEKYMEMVYAIQSDLTTELEMMDYTKKADVELLDADCLGGSCPVK
jgi:adenosylcobalamin-dependent ribonucleoside-triphosphate reductase